MPADVPVYYVLLSTEPAEPGVDRYGSRQKWVIRGAPSVEATQAWAIAQFEARTWGKEIPQRVTECLVAPFDNELVTEEGRELIDWLALPRLRDRRRPRRCGEPFDRDDDPLSHELHSSGMVRAPNKTVMPGPVIGTRDGKVTPEELRKLIEPQMGTYAARLNWDPRVFWYFIYYTPEWATLIRTYNSFAAAMLYVQAVRGTPLGDVNAASDTWSELTLYSAGDPRSEAQ